MGYEHLGEGQVQDRIDHKLTGKLELGQLEGQYVECACHGQIGLVTAEGTLKWLEGQEGTPYVSTSFSNITLHRVVSREEVATILLGT